jgi:hypothetical protein
MAIVGPIGRTSYAPLDSTPSSPMFDMPAKHLVACAALSFVGGIVAGWLTGRLAPARPMVHAIAMVGVLAALMVFQIAIGAGGFPARSHALLGIALLAGAVAGAYLATLRSPRTI